MNERKIAAEIVKNTFSAEEVRQTAYKAQDIKGMDNKEFEAFKTLQTMCDLQNKLGESTIEVIEFELPDGSLAFGDWRALQNGDLIEGELSAAILDSFENLEFKVTEIEVEVTQAQQELMENKDTLYVEGFTISWDR